MIRDKIVSSETAWPAPLRVRYCNFQAIFQEFMLTFKIILMCVKCLCYFKILANLHYDETCPLLRMQGDLMINLCSLKWPIVNRNELLIICQEIIFLCATWNAHKPGYDRTKIICCYRRKDSTTFIWCSRIPLTLF